MEIKGVASTLLGFYNSFLCLLLEQLFRLLLSDLLTMTSSPISYYFLPVFLQKPFSFFLFLYHLLLSTPNLLI